INFGIGQPSGDLTPPALFRELSEGFFARTTPAEFNYGDTRGDPQFIASLARFVERNYGMAVDPDTLFLTAGNSQALEFVCERFTKPGDVVFLDEPCYFLAFQILLDRGLEIVSIPLDAEGMQIEVLERELAKRKPALVYTIPSFNNPTGYTLSRARRERLADLSREHGFVVAADEVYQLLGYEGEVPPAMATLIDRGNIISMGSFSKILAPALRVGWIQSNTALMARMLESGWMNSGGAVNQFASLIVSQAIDSGALESHLEMLHVVYRSRRDAMHEALGEHFTGIARWHLPLGGYFFWITLLKDIETAPLKPRALAAGTGFQPGNGFSGPGDFRNSLRLSFAHYDETQIRDGVARLAAVLREAGA
ncbi:MAG: PLP-dependent aminotransferase family protein, partial [Gammaproteobacteria bacterium]